MCGIAPVGKNGLAGDPPAIGHQKFHYRYNVVNVG